MNPIHFKLCNAAPHPQKQDFSFNYFFHLLDSFNVKQRHEILEVVYSCLDVYREEKKYSDEDQWREEWYLDFKQHLIGVKQKYRTEEYYMVYGVLTYALARAVAKNDYCYWRKSIELHNELEFIKVSYNAFCEQVVKPLLEERLEEPLTSEVSPTSN